jgi:hypothetical protein
MHVEVLTIYIVVEFKTMKNCHVIELLKSSTIMEDFAGHHRRNSATRLQFYCVLGKHLSWLEAFSTIEIKQNFGSVYNYAAT